MTGFKKGFFGTLKIASPIASIFAPELAPVLGIVDKVGDMLGNGINKRKGRGRPCKMVKFNDNLYTQKRYHHDLTLHFLF